MRFKRRCHRTDDRSESGAVLLEFAFVALFLFALTMGMVEYGQAYRAQENTLAASRTGSRTAASLGKDQQADYQALSSLKAELLSSGLLDKVELVVVYRSATADGAPPDSCVSGGSSSEQCNIFTGAQLEVLTEGTFGTNGCSSNSVSSNWCPTSRIDDQRTADYVGLSVYGTHSSPTSTDQA